MSWVGERTEIVAAEGHLIDSRLLNAIFDKVIARRCKFEVLHFEIGRTNEEISRLELKVKAPNDSTLRGLLEDLMPLGCHPHPDDEIVLKSITVKGVVPEDFYSTTNHQTLVRYEKQWVTVGRQRMDAVIRVKERRAECVKLRDIRPGDRVVCGVRGIRVLPEFLDRERHGFAFMTNDVSTERRVEVSVSKVVGMMREVKETRGRIAFVAGPVVVHSGGVEYFSDLVRLGFVDVLLAGNALAVHDAEYSLFGTSLGIDLEVGIAHKEGHQHHMRAINAINGAGGIHPAVEKKILRSGIMYELVTRKIPYVLAGSIRDDGPLIDTEMDLIVAQDRYAEALEGVTMVVMLSTMLHSIGVGNMLPSGVRVICVDINPAVVTKLGDRGSAQTVGIVTDVGLFLHQLSAQLKTANGERAVPISGSQKKSQQGEQ